jgi:hypothetical protein
VTFKLNVDSKAEINYNKKYRDAEYNIHSYPDSLGGGGRKIVYLTAKRGKHEQVDVTVKEGATERVVHIKPIQSAVYYYNIYSFYGLGFVIDWPNENRFTFPRVVYIDKSDTGKRGYLAGKPLHNKKWEVTLNPPLINIYTTKFNYLEPSANPFGVVGGVNWHYKPQAFFSAGLGACFGSYFHLARKVGPSSFMYNAPLERKSDVYLNFMYNRQWGRFDAGAGLNVGRHTGLRFYQRYQIVDTAIYQADYMSLGAACSAHYRVWEYCYFGFSYMPQIAAVNAGNTKVLYEHALNFGISVRIGASKK